MRITDKTSHLLSVALIASFAIISCSRESSTIHSGRLGICFNDQMHTWIRLQDSTEGYLMKGYQVSEYIVAGKTDTVGNFRLKNCSLGEIDDEMGKGKFWELTGICDSKYGSISKILTVKVYDSFPDWAFYQVHYCNEGPNDLLIKKWINHSYGIDSRHDTPDFWSFQASSTGERKSWIQPVKPGFRQQNYMGMNDPDYGGGIPVIDLWRRDIGIAVGHTSLDPELVSFPVDMTGDPSEGHLAIEYDYREDTVLHAGDTLSTLETFVSLHPGDFFRMLRIFSQYMQKKGIRMADPEPMAFEPMWCAWGYMRKFTVDEIIGTLPKVKELGFTWVTVDDGYQQAEGDWGVNLEKFPKGDADMATLVKTIHSYGFKAQIWYSPLAMDPESRLMADHPELQLMNKDGSPQLISWWDSYYMSPAYQGTIDHTRAVIEKFLVEWNYDGLKLDGQHLNACPPDYNPKHGLSNPEDAPRSVPAFFKMIFETARQIKPDAVIQLCPCGDAMSFYNMPYTNQFVASDPVGSAQIRSKGKTYKAIAPGTAYFGDHVELSDQGSDFASTIGIGGVPGTKFTWPNDNPFSEESSLLTHEREAEWGKWINIYKSRMLSKYEYLGELYDIGYDVPETHVIRKADTLFYSFYADAWNGKVTFKGLDNHSYRIIDYVNGRDLGVISHEMPEMAVIFSKYLLLMAYPTMQ